MGDKTGIQWCDATWNPIRGCTRVSEGCRHCYAEAVAARFCGPGQPYEGLVKVITKEKVHRRDFADGSVELRKVETRDARWNGEVRFVAEHLADPLKWRKPRRIFVNSMSDLFHEKLTNEQIAAVFGVMAAAPQHTFIVLTKRSKRMREWFEWLETQRTPLITIPWSPRLTCRAESGKLLDVRGYHPMLGTEPNPHLWPLPNVILGVSVENQAAADERIPDLLATPAAVRAISAEPLLGPVDLRGWGDHAPAAESNAPEKWADFQWPDWVPAKQRESIEGFWSEANGRGPVDWLRNHRIQRVPATGARVTCSVDRSGWATINKMTTAGVSGRYLHAWNNIGRIITDDGQTIYASGGSGSGWLSKWLDGDGQYRSKLHWVIAGCESGPCARACSTEWLRSLRDQCAEADVPFFLKQAKQQIGASTLITTKEQAESRVQGKLMGTIPIIGEGPGSTRKPGGIISLPYLDGIQHAAFPEVKP